MVKYRGFENRYNLVLNIGCIIKSSLWLQDNYLVFLCFNLFYYRNENFFFLCIITGIQKMYMKNQIYGRYVVRVLYKEDQEDVGEDIEFFFGVQVFIFMVLEKFIIKMFCQEEEEGYEDLNEFRCLLLLQEV